MGKVWRTYEMTTSIQNSLCPTPSHKKDDRPKAMYKSDYISPLLLLYSTLVPKGTIHIKLQENVLAPMKT